MERTRIKFCGITNVEDALDAAELGADAVGLIIGAESKRRISTAAAREIVQALPPYVMPVALIMDAPRDEIKRLADEAGVDTVQLHGKEPPSLVEGLKGLTVIKVIREPVATMGEYIRIWRNVPNVSGLLVDTFSDKGPGGTGERNDWEALALLKSRGIFANAPPLVLAGGLTPEDVGAVVRKIRPFAVDVSSGIESEPGKKSYEKMKAFAAAVREADAAR